MVEESLNAEGEDPNDWVLRGLLFIQSARPAKAPPFFKKFGDRKKSHDVLLIAALEYDHLGDDGARDGVFDAWPQKNPYDPVLKLLRAKIAAGPKVVPSREEIEEALKKITPTQRLFADHAFGRFLQRRGAKQLAKEYFQRSINDSFNPNALGPVLSTLAAREIEREK